MNVRDFRGNRWLQCNDTSISVADEALVLRQAMGNKNSNTSAYFLIYVHHGNARLYNIF